MKNFSLYLGDKMTSICVDKLSTFDHKNFPGIVNNLKSCILLKQTHSVHGRAFIHDQETIGYAPLSIEGDYLITPLKNIGLAVATADCLPIVLYDTRQEVIALIHAGWRGSVAGITTKTVTHLQRDFGTQVSDIQVVFGPSARACCYEVDEPFLYHVQKFDGYGKFVQQRAGKYYFDNKIFNALTLEQLGIEVPVSESIPCTICDARFCSYRRQGKAAARQLTIVALV